jgi:hypothetical protein
MAGQHHNPEKFVLGFSRRENGFCSSLHKQVRKNGTKNKIVHIGRVFTVAKLHTRKLLISSPGEDVGFRNIYFCNI